MPPPASDACSLGDWCVTASWLVLFVHCYLIPACAEAPKLLDRRARIAFCETDPYSYVRAIDVDLTVFVQSPARRMAENGEQGSLSWTTLPP